MPLTLATLAAAPMTSSAWMFGTPYGGMIVRPTTASRWVTPADMLREQQTMLDRMFNAPLGRMSNQYKLTDNEEKFELAVAVPGYEMSDIEITLDESNKLLSVKGRKADTSDNYSFTSQFSQSFSLDTTVEVEKLTANLKNGVLIVSAPKDVKQIEQTIRQIPIMEATETAVDTESETMQQNKVEISDGNKEAPKAEDSDNNSERSGDDDVIQL
jgi:HSP20 family protein